MILTYFTGKEWPYETLDRLSGKLPGKWTWPTQSLLWLMEHGFEIRLIEEFSYEAFGKKGKTYLVEKCGVEVAAAQESHSDLQMEQKKAFAFARKGNVEYRVPELEDFNQLFKKGYLTLCNINASLLFGQPGYSGHFVVPLEITQDNVRLHDPGLPPKADCRVSRAIFEKSWSYPTEHEKNILAIRPATKKS